MSGSDPKPMSRDGDSGTHERARLLDELGALYHRERRRSEAQAHLMLLSKAFVSLGLHDRVPLGDTLNALVASFLEVKHAVTLVRCGSELAPVGVLGVEPEALPGPSAQRLLDRVLGRKLAERIELLEMASLWPDAPPWAADGLAALAIDVEDRAEGVMLLARKSSGQPITAEELDFLNAAAAVAAMAIANADAHTRQTALLARVEEEALSAKRAAAAAERARAELDRKLEVIARQDEAIRTLSAPVLEIGTDVLAVPLVGSLDQARASEMTTRILEAITSARARFVLIDVTGIDVVDTTTADALLKVVHAIGLLGAQGVLTGVRPAVAQTLAMLGADLGKIETQRSLADGLAQCLARAAASRAKSGSRERRSA